MKIIKKIHMVFYIEIMQKLVLRFINREKKNSKIQKDKKIKYEK